MAAVRVVFRFNREHGGEMGSGAPDLCGVDVRDGVGRGETDRLLLEVKTDSLLLPFLSVDALSRLSPPILSSYLAMLLLLELASVFAFSSPSLE